MSEGRVLEAREVSRRFAARGPRRRGVLALDRVSCSLECGRTLGVVGTSGSGKSTLGEVMGGLLAPTSGEVLFDGRPLSGLGRDGRRGLRRSVQFVFQDPVASMNPSFTVARVLDDPQRVLDRGAGAARRRARSSELLEMVGLTDDVLGRRPAELSGGQAQRVAIARALLSHPRVVVCDECTSALDVSVQAQILNLLRDLQAREGVSLLFISHDIGVVSYMADEVVVLDAGRLVESAPTREVVEAPRAAQTRALIDAARGLEP